MDIVTNLLSTNANTAAVAIHDVFHAAICPG